MDPRSRRGDRGGAGAYDDRQNEYGQNGAGGPPPPSAGGGDRYHPYGPGSGGGRPGMGALPPPPTAAANAGGYDPRQNAYGGMPGQIDLQNIVNTVKGAAYGHAPPGSHVAYGAPPAGYGAHSLAGYPPPPQQMDPRYLYGAPPGPPNVAGHVGVSRPTPGGMKLAPGTGHAGRAGSGGINEEVLCPSECAGKVIGHGGESIMQIQQRSGAHVKIQSSSEVPSGHPRIIYISGAVAAVAEARSLCQDIIREHSTSVTAKPGGFNSGGGSGGATYQPKEEMRLPVDMANVGKIIGRGGETIRRLSEESGARLQIERESGTVLIKGSDQACVRAKELILDIMNDPNPPGAPGGGSRTQNDFVKHEMNAEGCEGKIIGKGGESIRELCQRTGAKIQIDKELGTVSIQGKKENVDIAIATVQAIIDEGATVYMRPGGMPGEGDQRGQNNHQPAGGDRYEAPNSLGGTGGYAPAPAATKPLWETHKSPEGYTYYYNTTNGETQWDLPDDFPGVALP